jgi:hypothetical protein
MKWGLTRQKAVISCVTRRWHLHACNLCKHALQSLEAGMHVKEEEVLLFHLRLMVIEVHRY